MLLTLSCSWSGNVSFNVVAAVIKAVVTGTHICVRNGYVRMCPNQNVTPASKLIDRASNRVLIMPARVSLKSVELSVISDLLLWERPEILRYACLKLYGTSFSPASQGVESIRTKENSKAK